MKQKLTKVQRETLDALKTSRFGSLEVGPGMVGARTADALVRKGYCEYSTTRRWGGGECDLVIRLRDVNVVDSTK